MLKLLCRLPLAFSLTLALSFSSCTVYTPLQPSLPTICGAGQAEVRASFQPTLRAEASMAYSPINHLLLTAAGSWRPQLNVPDTTLFRIRRAEVGAGPYWAFGQGWTFSLLGGYGWGHCERLVTDGGFILSYSTDYFSRYKTTFGQFGLLHQGSELTLGFGYRLTRVHFQELRTRQYQFLPETQLRHEPFAAMRVNLGSLAKLNRWALEASVALALAHPGRVSLVAPYDPVPAHVNMNRGGVWLIGIGVVYSLGPRPAP